jgi:hypothetical protein
MKAATTIDRLRETELGLEKLCRRCDEWWPADLEFFFSDPSGKAGLFYCCKACYREWFAARKAVKASAAQGAAPC